MPDKLRRRNKFRQVADQIEYLKAHSILKAKRDRMLEHGEAIPEDMYIVGELMRRNRPAMGLAPVEAKP